jgi:hypothetical protein
MRKYKADSIVAKFEESGFIFEMINGSSWLEDIETAFGARFPEPYRDLLDHYRFPQFADAKVEFFSNLGEKVDGDICYEPFKDQLLLDWLVNRRYIQIARPITGSYAPICFDISAKKQGTPIIRLDHESILMGYPKVRKTIIAKSFDELVFNQN